MIFARKKQIKTVIVVSSITVADFVKKLDSELTKLKPAKPKKPEKAKEGK